VSMEAAELAEGVQGASSRMTTLYRLHAPRAGRLAYLLTGDMDLAEDLTQEAFVRLIGRLSGIRDEAAIDAYLRRSVVNLARKHWRKRGENGHTCAGGPERVCRGKRSPGPRPAASGSTSCSGRRRRRCQRCPT
jgi:DNA-directed RNA polymerase specialized sigma24 family protein